MKIKINILRFEWIISNVIENSKMYASQLKMVASETLPFSHFLFLLFNIFPMLIKYF